MHAEEGLQDTAGRIVIWSSVDPDTVQGCKAQALVAGNLSGGVSVKHLDAYLDEFTFRFNRRKSRSRGKLFYRLLERAVGVEPVPYKSLVKCGAMPPF